MPKNMEFTKPTTPSVIATLMGLDEIPSQQLVKKQKRQRALSENYLRKVASIGVWERRSSDERQSVLFSIEEQKEIKDGFNVTDSFQRGSGLFPEKGRIDLRLLQEKVPPRSTEDAEDVPVDMNVQPLDEVHSGQSEQGFVDSRMDCIGNQFQELDYQTTKHFYDQEDAFSYLQSSGHQRGSSNSFDSEKRDIHRKVWRRTDEENPKLLQKPGNCSVKDSQREYVVDGICMIPRFYRESNHKKCPSRKTFILKPKPEKAENATNFLPSPGFSEYCFSGNRKDKRLFNLGKGNSLSQVEERKNFYGTKSTRQRSIRSSKTEKEITRTRHNFSSISMEPPRLGFSGVYSHAKEPDFMMVSSPNNSDLNNCSKPSCFYLDGSYVAQEAKKQISERWRMTKEFRENELTFGGKGKSRTLGEMLAFPDHDKCVNFHHPLGISSRDGWNNGGAGDLRKSKFSTSSIRPKCRSCHKVSRYGPYMTTRPTFSFDLSKLKSSKQFSIVKEGLERKNLRSNCKKSQSSPCIEPEKNHSLEDKCVAHNKSKNNLEKQDPSEESSIVSKDNIVNPGSENKISTAYQWDNIKDGNVSGEGVVVPESSVFSVASPSVACGMVADVESVAIGKSTHNHKQQQFELTGCTVSGKDYDSSLCIPHALSQQEDISLEIFECGTDPDSLVNLETAYQPSPVSVLEAPFGEESLSRSKCFESVSVSLQDVRRQLEFLKSESPEGYSEGCEMIVSSDEDEEDDVGEVSLQNCEVTKDLMSSFGLEESRDFSYLVDVLTEAGFYSRNKNLCFDGWHSPEIPISLSVFLTLEKKYGEQISWKRSARRLLFDRINSGLLEILQPCLGEPKWAQPVARRLNYRQNLNEIEEELYMLLVKLENEARKNSSEKVLGNDDGWLFLGYEIEVIGKEIENSLIEELLAEVVSVDSF